MKVEEVEKVRTFIKAPDSPQLPARGIQLTQPHLDNDAPAQPAEQPADQEVEQQQQVQDEVEKANTAAVSKSDEGEEEENSAAELELEAAELRRRKTDVLPPMSSLVTPDVTFSLPLALDYVQQQLLQQTWDDALCQPQHARDFVRQLELKWCGEDGFVCKQLIQRHIQAEHDKQHEQVAVDEQVQAIWSELHGDDGEESEEEDDDDSFQDESNLAAGGSTVWLRRRHASLRVWRGEGTDFWQFVNHRLRASGHEAVQIEVPHHNWARPTIPPRV